MKSIFLIFSLIFYSLSYAHETNIKIEDYAAEIVNLPNGDVLIKYPHIDEYRFSLMSDKNKLCEVVFGFRKGYDVFYKKAYSYGNTVDDLFGYIDGPHYVVSKDGKLELSAQEILKDSDGNLTPKHQYITQISCSNTL
jgi:hypothetical protein